MSNEQKPDTSNLIPENPRNAGLEGRIRESSVSGQGELLILPKPRKPWMRPYNGWTYRERCAVTPIQNKALREGRLKRPAVCSICGHSKPDDPKGAGYIFLHTERYDRPLDLYPACKRCHAALHARFDDPARWMAMAKANWREGAWFTLLSMHPASQFQPFGVTYPRGLEPVLAGHQPDTAKSRSD